MVSRRRGASKGFDEVKKLRLSFHGRIIDSLGIQMYQSPVAAVAELIANAWDADAKSVAITLPLNNDEGAEIIVADLGSGMTFNECQERYLSVGRNRRLTDGQTTPAGRPLLGRKGIGKFAGFGIAKILEIDTTSAITGERTAFRLDLDKLRSDAFVSNTDKEIEIILWEGPDDVRRSDAGTTVRLKALVLKRRLAPETFVASMARRFVLARQAANFQITVNGLSLPDEVDPIGNSIQFVFPPEYVGEEKPDGLTITADGWAREILRAGEEIEWQIKFTQKPIAEEELRGIAVYCGVKLAQTPFFFQLSGGLAGQHGQQYVTGRVKADYLDQLDADIITTERQRINWEDVVAARLLDWGQERVKQLLSLWESRRSAGKLLMMEERLTNFSRRIGKLPRSEAKIVKGALLRLAGIAAIDPSQFEEVANAVLTAWEGGRLREIIEQVSRIETMNADVLIGVLSEHQVLTALHVAEAVKLKLGVVDGLRRRIEAREIENAVRDYIAANPWLISPQWDTFRVERGIGGLIEDALQDSGIKEDTDWKGRVDLALSSGAQLLILEFMRPGLTVDRDHINRFSQYVDILRARVKANTSLGFRDITGLLVADKLHQRPENQLALDRMAKDGMQCQEWRVLLSKAEAQWKDFLFVLAQRAPEDDRIKALTTLDETRLLHLGDRE